MSTQRRAALRPKTPEFAKFITVPGVHGNPQSLKACCTSSCQPTQAISPVVLGTTNGENVVFSARNQATNGNNSASSLHPRPPALHPRAFSFLVFSFFSFFSFVRFSFPGSCLGTHCIRGSASASPSSPNRPERGCWVARWKRYRAIAHREAEPPRRGVPRQEPGNERNSRTARKSSPIYQKHAVSNAELAETWTSAEREKPGP
jgi:hypothetical protein